LPDVQLVAISAFCLIGVGVLAARRQGAGRPLRRSVSLLVDAFALGLVMIAALFLTGAFEWPYFETIRRATFLIIGLAPAAFLVGLLSARLARLALADLLLEMRAEPAPADLRDALARALRDPSLLLAYWLPEYGSWADVDGREVQLPRGRGRASNDAHRSGRCAHGRAGARRVAARGARAARRGQRRGRDRARERAVARRARRAPR
jgi:hypothetical protein